MKIFVYGSLMRGFHNHHILNSSKLIGEATTSAGRFRMINLGSFPALVKGDGNVKGEVYEVNPATLGRLDRLEGAPSFYHRESINVEVSGQVVAAQAYVLSRADDGREIVPNGDWRAFQATAPTIR